MKSPLESLFGTITHTFENPNGSAIDSLKSAIDMGLINPAINVIDHILEKEKYRPVSITRKPNSTQAEIQFDIQYLHELWAFIYGWFVIYEKAIMEPWMAGQFNGEIHCNTPLLNRAQQLKSRVWDNDKNWPSELPSPLSWTTEVEKIYTELANTIFVNAVAFLIYHEFAHAKQGHFEARESQKHKVENKELEREADEYAFSSLISQTDDEQVRRLKGWSVLAPVLMSLNSTLQISTLFPTSHPFVHHRVNEFLKRLNFRTDRNQDYFAYLCMTIAGMVLGRFKLDFEQKTFNTTSEGLSFYLDALDDLQTSSS